MSKDPWAEQREEEVKETGEPCMEAPYWGLGAKPLSPHLTCQALTLL